MNEHHDFATEFADQAVKGSFPVTVTAAHLMGVSLQDWVFYFTLVYLALQISLLVRKWGSEIDSAVPDGWFASQFAKIPAALAWLTDIAAKAAGLAAAVKGVLTLIRRKPPQ